MYMPTSLLYMLQYDEQEVPTYKQVIPQQIPKTQQVEGYTHLRKTNEFLVITGREATFAPAIVLFI